MRATAFAVAPAVPSRAQRRNNADADSHAISIDALQKESQHLSSASSQLDHLTGNAMSVLGALNEQRSSLKGIQKKARRRRSNWSLPAATLVPQPHHPPGARHCEHAGSIEQRHPSDREQAVLGQDARVRRHAAHPCTALVCLCSDATGHRTYPLHRGIESTLLVCLCFNKESIASEQLRSEMPRARAAPQRVSYRGGLERP